jgi:hypothetical protein
MDLYRLRDAPRSVKLAAVLFLLVLGYSYIFAFLMVKTWSGLSASDVQATYVPKPAMNMEAMPEHSTSAEQPLDLKAVPEMKHTVDTNLLIQDSHIHIMIYAIVAALQSLIIFGLGWPDWFRDWMIVAAFGFGALDFAGQWLMKANLPGFAWLTILSGWGMSLVYLIVLGGTLRAVVPRRTIARSL